MKRPLFYFWILLWTLMGPPLATQTCTDLHFRDFNGSTLYTEEGNNISVVFQFTTAKCPKQPERILVKLTSDNEGFKVEYCKVTIDMDSCKPSDSSLCRCLDKSGLIEFSKEVNRTDNRRYTWIWSDSLSQSEGHRSIRFYVNYSSPSSQGVPEALTVTYPVTGRQSHVPGLREQIGQRSEQSQAHGTVAAITATCIVIGVAVSAVVTYFIIKKRADLYDHLKLSRQSVSYRVTGSARAAPSLKAIDGLYENETYEDVLEKSSVPCEETLVWQCLPRRACHLETRFTCWKNVQGDATLFFHSHKEKQKGQTGE